GDAPKGEKRVLGSISFGDIDNRIKELKKQLDQAERKSSVNLLTKTELESTKKLREELSKYESLKNEKVNTIENIFFGRKELRGQIIDQAFANQVIKTARRKAIKGEESTSSIKKFIEEEMTK